MAGSAWLLYSSLDDARYVLRHPDIPRLSHCGTGAGLPLSWGVFQDYYQTNVFPDASEVCCPEPLANHNNLTSTPTDAGNSKLPGLVERSGKQRETELLIRAFS